MKILPINNQQSTVSSASTAQAPNFKGLWGDSKEIFETSFKNNSYDYEGNAGTTSVYRLEKEYYPFLDETDTYIAGVRASAERVSEQHTGDVSMKQIRTVVKIMQRIPVLAETYAQYIRRELLSQAEMKVEDALKMAKMQRFLR